jgi:hypothetical protein
LKLKWLLEDSGGNLKPSGVGTIVAIAVLLGLGLSSITFVITLLLAGGLGSGSDFKNINIDLVGNDPPPTSTYLTTTVTPWRTQWFFPVPDEPSSPLALAIHRRKSTGAPDLDEATRLAWIIEEHCSDPWLIAALMSVESGFRADAREGCALDAPESCKPPGPGRGILQLHHAYLPIGLTPYRVGSAIKFGCKKLEKFRIFHTRYCTTWRLPHPFLAHWFCGFDIEGCHAGITSALKVVRAEEALRASVGD